MSIFLGLVKLVRSKHEIWTHIEVLVGVESGLNFKTANKFN